MHGLPKGFFLLPLIDSSLDALTRQHFTCPGHYYGRSWNWFLEKLVDLNHACWCLSMLWIAIPESK